MSRTGAQEAAELFERYPRRRYVGFVLSLGSLACLPVGLFMVFSQGLGALGVNSSNVWSLLIVLYGFWAAVSAAGVMLAAVPFLLGERLPTPLSRLAQAVSVAGIVTTGIFPIVHLGRSWLFYWLLPYPNSMGAWPQFKSALFFDMAGIIAFLVYALVAWWVGLLPDLATMRSAATPRQRWFLHLMPVGWSGTARDWAAWLDVSRGLAICGLALLLVVHLCASLDFSAGLLPSWNASLGPFEAILDAVLAGTATTALAAALIGMMDKTMTRRLGLVLAGAGVGLLYVRLCGAYLDVAHPDPILGRLDAAYGGGLYQPFPWLADAGRIAAPLLLLVPALRHRPWFVALVALAALAGVFSSELLQTFGPLSRSYLPTQWQAYRFGWSGLLIVVGSAGLFSAILGFLCWLVSPRPAYERLRGPR